MYVTRCNLSNNSMHSYISVANPRGYIPGCPRRHRCSWLWSKICSVKNEGRAGEQRKDFWLGWPTRRLPKSAHVLSKDPESLALGLVLLAYSIGLVQTVRGGQSTCYVCGPQNPGIGMPNSINKHRFSGFLFYGDRYFIYGKIYPCRVVCSRFLIHVSYGGGTGWNRCECRIQ